MELDCIPLIYLKDHEEVLKRSVNDGKCLTNLYSQRHGFNSGWTLINGPFEEQLVDAEAKNITNATHIESDVLVDYQEAFNRFPFWKPSLEQPIFGRCIHPFIGPSVKSVSGPYNPGLLRRKQMTHLKTSCRRICSQIKKTMPFY